MAIEDFLRGQLQRIETAMQRLAEAAELLDIAEEGGQIVIEQRAEVQANFDALQAQKDAILKRHPDLAGPAAAE